MGERGEEGGLGEQGRPSLWEGAHVLRPTVVTARCSHETLQLTQALCPDFLDLESGVL